MKPIPGTLQEGGAAFQATHWTLILRARQSDPTETAREALSDFCEAYWPPLYTFLRLRGHASPEAQDLLQSFFVHLLEKNTLSRADKEKGRLRTFLLGSLQNFLVQRVRSARRSNEAAVQQIVRSTNICPKPKHQ
jgi:RNA polymerase sigma-70 factor (ECF subfamily)